MAYVVEQLLCRGDARCAGTFHEPLRLVKGRGALRQPMTAHHEIVAVLLHGLGLDARHDLVEVFQEFVRLALHRRGIFPGYAWTDMTLLAVQWLRLGPQLLSPTAISAGKIGKLAVAAASGPIGLPYVLYVRQIGIRLAVI